MSDMIALLNDLSYIPLNNEQNEPTQGDIGEISNEPTQAKRNEFEELYASANEELYLGCDYVTRLDFMAKFTYFKVKGKLTDFIFNEMLEFFQHVFPTMKGYKLPSSYYAIKNTFKTIRLGYESIHACVNDCFLFRGDNNKDVHLCPVCKTSRWKDSNTSRKKVPKKVLRYFSIIPKLQRLYNSSHTVKEMTWHATGKCTEPGKMQHLVDGKHRRTLTPSLQHVAGDIDNIKYAFLVMYEREFFMLTLLIPGPKSPGKDIDFYLRPLIDDLKVLWALKGVETTDIATGQKMFPFKKFMKKLKGYVRNKAKLEGSIAEGYVVEEALTFNSHYFQDVTMKFNRLDRNVDPPPPTPEIDTYRSQFKSKFPNKDMKEEFLDCTTSELFALACGPTPTLISVNSYVVNGVRFVVHCRDERRTTQNSNICSPDGKDGEMYYDMARSQPHFKVVEDVNHKKFSNEGVIMVEEDSDVIHFDNSSDLPLSTSLNDLDNVTLHIDDSDDEDLVNIDDDDGVDMSADVARGHGGNGGGDDRPVPIWFEWDDKKTLMPLGDYASHWSNYLGELIREMPLYYPSWQKVLAERKAVILTKIGMESSPTREYPSLIHTFFVTHTVNGVLMRDEVRAIYVEMLRLQALGSNTPSGVPYTEKEINALARKGKKRGHLLGVGWVLPRRAIDVFILPPHPPPQCTHNSSDVEKIKKKNNYLTKQVNLMTKLFKSDDKFSQMLNQYESTPEFGNASRSGGFGDDEMANDEDGGEDGEDDEDGDS
nr:hypothetical protein [Tanacetum cinerariifolium]